MNLALINSVLFRAYSKLETCTENYYCLVLKFHEPYLLLTINILLHYLCIVNKSQGFSSYRGILYNSVV